MDEAGPPPRGGFSFDKRAYLKVGLVGIAGLAVAVAAVQVSGVARIALWVIAGLLLVVPALLAIETMVFLVAIGLTRGTAHALTRPKVEAWELASLVAVAVLLGALLGTGAAIAGPGAMAVVPALVFVALTVWNSKRLKLRTAHRLAAVVLLTAVAAAATGTYILFIS